MNRVMKILVYVLAGLTAALPVLGSRAIAAAQSAESRIATPSPNIAPEDAIDRSVKAKAQEAYGKLPLHFVQNDGQLGKKVRYYEQGSGRSTFFTEEGVYFSLSGKTKGGGQVRSDRGAKTSASAPELIKLSPVGAGKGMKVTAAMRQAGSVNYFVGQDPAKWKSGIATYKEIVYEEAYQGIDLRFYGNNSKFEYDVIVRPGADLSKVAFSIKGIKGMSVTRDGDLRLSLSGGAIVQKKPVVYQEVNGKRVAVDGKFTILKARNPRQKAAFAYGFQVAAYDRTRDLVIDPVLVYSTYLGGAGGDAPAGIAVDAAGYAYVVGVTNSPDFPVSSLLNVPGSNYGNVFVTKLNPAGNALVYSTFIGGSGSDDFGSGDSAEGIAVDVSGNVYITGQTFSSNFPTASPVYGTLTGYCDAFVTKLNPAGNAPVYSTYLGGSHYDGGTGIAVDAAGNAYIAGYTFSSDFPTSTPLYGAFSGGEIDAFVTKLNPSGNAIVYSTYLGGSGYDDAGGIAVDASGNAYVAGATSSSDFPTSSPLFGTLNGVSDAFVTKINPSGNALVYSTFLGGNGLDGAGGIGLDGNGNPHGGIAVDASGYAYVTGTTTSADFPTSSPIYGTFTGGNSDAFVTKLSPSGDALVYSTYLGGSGDEIASTIAADPAGNAYVVVTTKSSDFPMSAPVYGTFNGGNKDIVVSKISPSGNALVYSTYLGGSDNEYATGVAVDADGNAYVTGYTLSTDFPTAAPLSATKSGWTDAFVTKISAPSGNTPTGTNVVVSPTASTTLTFTGITSPGQTAVTQSGTGTPPPAGFKLGAPPSYYEVTTTAVYSGPVTVCIVYDEASFGANENTLRLLHRESGQWVDVTSSLDTATNTICGTVTSFSEFVIVMRDTVQPLTSLVGSPAANANGWNNTPVTVTLTAADNPGGTGVEAVSYRIGADPEVTTAGSTTSFVVANDGIFGISFYAKDIAGNIETPTTAVVKIDQAKPSVVVEVPANGAEYLLGQFVAATWSAGDSLSGIASASGTQSPGTAIDTASVGAKTFTVNATDRAGNTATTSSPYVVRYGFGGVLRPVNADGSSLFKLGSTVPVKFRLTDAGGSFVANAAAQIYLAKTSDNLVGTEEQAVATDAATTGNLFRYDSVGNQYVFNLSTSGLSVGTYQVRITLDDGSSKLVLISLR